MDNRYETAYYQILNGDTLYDIQGTYDVYNVDSLYTWGVWMNGPALLKQQMEKLGLNGGTNFDSNSKKPMWAMEPMGIKLLEPYLYFSFNYESDAQIGLNVSLELRV